MLFPVEQGHPQIDHRKVRERTLVERFMDALLDSGDEVTRHGAADDLVDKLIAATFVRLDDQCDARVLPVAAGLLLVDVFRLDLSRHRLAIRHLRRVQFNLDAELALHPLGRDLNMRIAHPRQDGLARGLVAMHNERRIFLGNAVERRSELVDVAFSFRRNGDVEWRLWKLDRSQRGGVLLRAERVAGDCVRQFRHRADIARSERRRVILRLAFQQDQLADALVDIVVRVPHVCVAAQRARDHTHVGQPPDERIRRRLEYKRF